MGYLQERSHMRKHGNDVRLKIAVSMVELLEGRVLLSTTLPAAHWRLDEASGLSAVDASGNGNTAQLLNGATWTTGRSLGAVQLDGVNDRLEAADSASLDLTGNFALSLWFKTTRRTNQTLLKKASTGSVNGYEIGLTSNGLIYARFNQATSGDSFRVNSSSTYRTDGTWTHVTVSYDGKNLSLYVNAVLQRSPKLTFSLGTNSLPLSIGAENNSTLPLLGAVDDVRLFARKLGATDVRAIYQFSQPPMVNAGPDQQIELPSAASLSGTATDDRLPNPPAALTIAWTKVSGPGTVTFGSNKALSTTATFSRTGVYVLRLSAGDGADTTTDDITINVQPPNAAPVVNAGADRSVELPANSAQLSGSVIDDGLPNPPAATSSLWSVVSGPASVDFADATSPTTLASFSTAGTYVLRLTANDGRLSSSDDVTVTVYPPNAAPVVSAGQDQSITLPASASLSASASDDGLPLSPGTVNTLWTKTSGPGNVVFGNASALSTTASFSVAGTYILRLTASDGQLQSSDDITIVVSPAAFNLAPTVLAGDDQTVPVATGAVLAGSVSDDGLPNPPGAVSVHWMKLSGPGVVSFADGAAAQTTANFSGPGTYVLQLSATDGALSASDTVKVVVTAAPDEGLVGYWSLDDGQGATAADASGFGNNGTLTTGVSWASTISSQGLDFDGSGARVVVADNASLDLSGPMTLAAWIKPTQGTTQTIVRKSRYGSVDGFELTLSSSGTVFVRFNQKTSGNTYRVNSTSAYPANGYSWMHVAATYDGSVIRLYINGVEEGSLTRSFTIGTNSVPLTLGAEDGGNYAFRGQMDDVRVYNRALGPAEIAALENINRPPVVHAGPDSMAVPHVPVGLSGSVTDDGLPNPPGSVSTLWSLLSGPGSVLFDDATSVTTAATFSTVGTYVLRLVGDDGSLVSDDTVTVYVENQLPAVTNLDSTPLSANTGEKPQSKLWTYQDRWWAVLPNSSGTWLWRLDGTSWTAVLKLSDLTNIHADTKQVDDRAYVMLYHGQGNDANPDGESSGFGAALAQLQYQTDGTYALVSAPAAVPLSAGIETVSFDIDTTGRLWLAQDTASTIEVRYSDGAYTAWSAPITLATGITTDDIAAIKAFDGKIGVLWSNQNAQRFGFRTHADGADPSVWSALEVPASGSALPVGSGMADDHLSLAASADGTLYAAVKTSYDAVGYPMVGLLVRRPDGQWDPLYTVDTDGTRPIIAISPDQNRLVVIYTALSSPYDDIVYKSSPLSQISFSARQILMAGALNNATSLKGVFGSRLIVLASDADGNLQGAQLDFPVPTLAATSVSTGAGDDSLPDGFFDGQQPSVWS